MYLLICVIFEKCFFMICFWTRKSERKTYKNKTKPEHNFSTAVDCFAESKFANKKILRAKRNCAQKGFLFRGRFDVKSFAVYQCSEFFNLPQRIPMFSYRAISMTSNGARLKKLSAAWRRLSLKQLVTFNGPLSEARPRNAKDIRLMAGLQSGSTYASAPYNQPLVDLTVFFLYSIQSFSIVRVAL